MQQEIMEFYSALGFEEVEVEDNLTAFFLETDDTGSYVLVTDDEGELPATIKQKVIFASYTAAGSFQWSVSFKNSYLFREEWLRHEAVAEKLTALLAYREENERF